MTAPLKPMALDDPDDRAKWVDEATTAIHQTAQHGHAFTADDLYAGGLREQPGINLMRTALRRAVTAGVITQAGVTKSTRRERKGGWTAIWQPTQHTKTAA